MTLKTGLGFVQGLWQWHYLIDRIRIPIRLPWRYLVSFARYSDLFVEDRDFYTQPVFNAPARGDPVGISLRYLMLVKLEWLGYRMLKKKLWRYVKPFSSDTGTLRTDRRTDRQTDRRDRFAISISRVSMLTLDKNDVTVKTGLGFVREHWKWHHLIDRTRVTKKTMTRC